MEYEETIFLFYALIEPIVSVSARILGRQFETAIRYLINLWFKTQYKNKAQYSLTIDFLLWFLGIYDVGLQIFLMYRIEVIELVTPWR